jgi:hypothetical protein
LGFVEGRGLDAGSVQAFDAQPLVVTVGGTVTDLHWLVTFAGETNEE